MSCKEIAPSGVRSIYGVRGSPDNFSKAIISLGNYYALRILFGAHSMTSEGALSDAPRPKTFTSGANLTRQSRISAHSEGTELKAVLRSVIDTLLIWLLWDAQL